MFKNYLTYTFVLNFQLGCRNRELPPLAKERLLLSADQTVLAMLKSIHAPDPQDELRYLVAALLSVRDCKDCLRDSAAWTNELRTLYEVVHGRLEKLVEVGADKQGGQLRMLG
jgi:hypothetical protein